MLCKDCNLNLFLVEVAWDNCSLFKFPYYALSLVGSTDPNTQSDYDDPGTRTGSYNYKFVSVSIFLLCV